jgi:hypothetical protein
MYTGSAQLFARLAHLMMVYLQPGRKVKSNAHLINISLCKKSEYYYLEITPIFLALNP